jgi:DMSO reductase anchor subunit
MGYRIGRKHAEKLRNISRLFAFGLPFILSLAILALPDAPAAAAALLTALSASLGVVVERWLFFAEAKHTVALYYGYENSPTAASSRARTV